MKKFNYSFIGILNYKFIFLVLTICLNSYCSGWSQSVSNIDLPYTDYVKGSVAIEVISADGYLFVYSMDGIKILDESSDEFVKEIDFGTNYGKFNPIYFNSRLTFGDANLMALNVAQHILYVVYPNLTIHCINTSTLSHLNQTFNPLATSPPGGQETLPSYFAPLHGGCILKYDNNHRRLYWVIYGRDPEANVNPGQFHFFSRFFTILNADQLSGSLSWYYTDLNEELDNGNYYDRNISDVEYNYNNNFYYLTKLNKIEIWEVTINGPDEVEGKYTIDVPWEIYGGSEQDPNFYKFGEMLYINSTDAHQIIALPYKYPSSLLTEGYYPLVYVIDGDWNGIGDVSFATFNSPSEKISDGIFVHHGTGGPDDLVLSYSPNIEDHLISGENPSDVAIYRLNTSLGYNWIQTILTETPSQISDYDINTPFKLIQIGGSSPTILIGKKDGVSKIQYNNNTYLTDQVYNAESNFFRNGLYNNYTTKCYFLNAVANGIEVFNNSEYSQSIQMGYPVYNIAGNSDGSKMFFFNTLQAHKVGLFIYENSASVNINSDDNDENNIDKSIGDCIYNPYKDHFLISEYAYFGSSSPAIIRVISADANNSFVQDIALTDDYNNHYQFPKELFISPEGRLYVLVNMHRDKDVQPPVVYVLEFSADDQGSIPAYSFIKKYDVVLPSFVDDYDCYAAHFCYNAFNRSVYASIHPTELTLDPYNTVVNSIFDFPLPTDDRAYTGSMIKITDGSKTQNDLYYPGKVICPGTEFPDIDTQFKGKMYIIGKQFYELNAESLNYTTYATQPFNDITYCPYHDKMFAIRDSPGSSGDQRICEIYSIDNINDNLTFNLLGSFPDQASSITYNPYDGKVYIYKKYDDWKLGGESVKILSFNPGSYPIQIASINCSFNNLYPEIDHNPDHHYYLYNITEPYLDPIHNAIYFPNGANSSVSKLNFASNTDETIPLNPSGFTWLSFPRLLNRFPTNPTVNEVLGGYVPNVRNISPSDYLPFSSWLQNLPPQHDLEVESVFTGSIWPSSEFLTNIDSKSGYKLQLAYDPAPQKTWLHMHGTVQPAITPLTIYRRYDNWIGYWLYETQSPFDAFPSSVLDELSAIIAQNWMCSKYAIIRDGVGIPVWFCACHEGRVELKYGDMVNLQNPAGVTGEFSFQWQRYGNPVSGIHRPETEYFLFTEQAEYIPYIIELDSTELASEIGAFVNDTCVGATAILPGDTLVLVPGYVEGMNGEVYFELYYDSLKSGSPQITEYLVVNPKTMRKQSRTIYSTEKQDYFLVSFKGSPNESNITANVQISLYPNPARDRCLVNFTQPMDGKTKIEIYDLYGRKVHILSEGYLPAGAHRVEFKFDGKADNKLAEGVYLVQVQSGQYKAQAKLIILQ